MFLLAGDAQARGVYLEGYGIFFDVAVPMLRQSMMWSLRMMLQQDDSSTKKAIAELRRHIQTETDPARRQNLEAAMSPAGSAGEPLCQRGTSGADGAGAWRNPRGVGLDASGAGAARSAAARSADPPARDGLPMADGYEPPVSPNRSSAR